MDMVSEKKDKKEEISSRKSTEQRKPSLTGTEGTVDLAAEWESFEKLIGGSSPVSASTDNVLEHDKAVPQPVPASSHPVSCTSLMSNHSERSMSRKGSSSDGQPENGESTDSDSDNSESDSSDSSEASESEDENDIKSDDKSSKRGKDSSSSEEEDSEDSDSDEEDSDSSSASDEESEEDCDTQKTRLKPSSEAAHKPDNAKKQVSERKDSHSSPPAKLRSRRSRSRSKSRRSKSRSRSRRDSSPHRNKDRRSNSSRDHKRRRNSHRSHCSRSRERKFRRRSRSRSRSRSRRHRRYRDRRKRSRSHSAGRERAGHRRRRHRRSRSHSHSRDRGRDHRQHHRKHFAITRAEKKPLTYKETLRQKLLEAQKLASEGKLEIPSDYSKDLMKPNEKPSALPLNMIHPLMSIDTGLGDKVTPQQALAQTMAAMHQKAQQLTGVALPKYYNPAAVNPLKFADQVKKRKLLWSQKDDASAPAPAQGPSSSSTAVPQPSSSTVASSSSMPTTPPPDLSKGAVPGKNQWKTSTAFIQDDDGKVSAKFRKLMGIKQGEAPPTESELANMNPEARDDIEKQQKLFHQLDREYEFARMTTHTHRGLGLGFGLQSYQDPSK